MNSPNRCIFLARVLERTFTGWTDLLAHALKVSTTGHIALQFVNVFIMAAISWQILYWCVKPAASSKSASETTASGHKIAQPTNRPTNQITNAREEISQPIRPEEQFQLECSLDFHGHLWVKAGIFALAELWARGGMLRTTTQGPFNLYSERAVYVAAVSGRNDRPFQ